MWRRLPPTVRGLILGVVFFASIAGLAALLAGA